MHLPLLVLLCLAEDDFTHQQRAFSHGKVLSPSELRTTYGMGQKTDCHKVNFSAQRDYFNSLRVRVGTGDMGGTCSPTF